MSSPLDNPFAAFDLDAGEAPPWLWKMAGMLAGILGAVLVREVIDRGRARASGRGTLKVAPGDKAESWPTALAWAGVVGVAGAVGRLLAQRAVATTWTRRVAMHRA